MASKELIEMWRQIRLSAFVMLEAVREEINWRLEDMGLEVVPEEPEPIGGEDWRGYQLNLTRRKRKIATMTVTVGIDPEHPDDWALDFEVLSVYRRGHLLGLSTIVSSAWVANNILRRWATTKLEKTVGSDLEEAVRMHLKESPKDWLPEEPS